MGRAYARCFWFLECYPSATLLEVGRAVEGYLRFCKWCQWSYGSVWGLFELYMVIYRSEHLFRCYYQARHLPYGHLKVHLREFEQTFEEAWHSESFTSA